MFQILFFIYMMEFFRSIFLVCLWFDFLHCHQFLVVRTVHSYFKTCCFNFSRFFCNFWFSECNQTIETIQRKLQVSCWLRMIIFWLSKFSRRVSCALSLLLVPYISSKVEICEFYGFCLLWFGNKLISFFFISFT